MKTSVHHNHIAYHEGEYSLEVYSYDIFLKHKCTKSTSTDDCYNHILPDEVKENRCRYCCEVDEKLDIPEGLQALYYLYRWGEQDEVMR